MFLLDTHAFLWFIAGDDHLSRRARVLMLDNESALWLSAASLWEIAIKVSMKKLILAAPFAQLIPEQLQQNSISVLPVQLSDLARLVELPFHHRDPFDRLIAAQSLANSLPLVSVDPIFDLYLVERIWGD